MPNINIAEFWDGESSFFDLPPFGHTIQEMVMPLIGTRNKRTYPIGTCFLVSKFGLVMSAAHNVTYGLITHSEAVQRSVRKIHRHDGKTTFRLSDFSLSGFWQRSVEAKLDGQFWPLVYVTQNKPMDIVFGIMAEARQPESGEMLMHKHLKLSPGMPRAGSRVFAVGYHDMQLEGNLTLSNDKDGKVSLNIDYDHRLSVSVGTVKTLYSECRDNGMFCFPCFKTDASIPHGFSGGPVFNEDGSVCGIACGESLAGSNESFVSLIYPSLTTHLNIAFKDRAPGTNPLELIAANQILTDGTEAKATYKKTGPETFDWTIDYKHEAINNGHCFKNMHEEEKAKLNK